MLEYVSSDNAVDLWTASDIREDSPEDADQISDDDIGALFHSGDGDGALVIGTPASIIECLDTLRAKILASAAHQNIPSTPLGTLTEQYVLIHGFSTQEQVDDLRTATGMLPGDMGRWKGGDHLLISDEYVEKAIAWAQRTGRTYEVSRTERFDPH